MLPAKLKSSLVSKLEQASKDDGDLKVASAERIRKFRNAFFETIVDLFLNYKQRIT